MADQDRLPRRSNQKASNEETSNAPDATDEFDKLAGTGETVEIEGEGEVPAESRPTLAPNAPNTPVAPMTLGDASASDEPDAVEGDSAGDPSPMVNAGEADFVVCRQCGASWDKRNIRGAVVPCVCGRNINVNTGEAA